MLRDEALHWDSTKQPADIYPAGIRDVFEGYHACFANITRRDAAERFELYDQRLAGSMIAAGYDPAGRHARSCVWSRIPYGCERRSPG